MSLSLNWKWKAWPIVVAMKSNPKCTKTSAIDSLCWNYEGCSLKPNKAITQQFSCDCSDVMRTACKTAPALLVGTCSPIHWTGYLVGMAWNAKSIWRRLLLTACYKYQNKCNERSAQFSFTLMALYWHHTHAVVGVPLVWVYKKRRSAPFGPVRVSQM